jgi:RND family efflux transporter MFP subunit
VAEEKRASRDDLAALRIDRGAVTLKPKPRWRGWLLVGLAVLAFAVASVTAYRMTLGRVAAVQVAFAEAGGTGGAAPAATVLTGSGYVVTGERYIALGVRVPSRIEKYLVEEGEKVTAGQVLVQLDARQYEAALGQARANLQRAQADVALQKRELERSQLLFQRNVESRAELDLAQNRLNVAVAEVALWESAVRRAEVDLDDTVIRAPTAGVILEKFKEVGEIAVPGGFEGSGELIRMANLEDMRAELDVNEADLARIAMGQRAEVKPDAYPDKVYAARVVKLYPQINRQKGTLKVEVQIEQPDEWLRPDMSVRITFLADAEPVATGGEEKAPIAAPRAAIRSDDDGTFAWVVTGGKVRRQAVSTGGERGDRVVVKNGLLGGEALVVGGDTDGLREGQRVETDP